MEFNNKNKMPVFDRIFVHDNKILGENKKTGELFLIRELTPIEIFNKKQNMRGLN